MLPFWHQATELLTIWLTRWRMTPRVNIGPTSAGEEGEIKAPAPHAATCEPGQINGRACCLVSSRWHSPTFSRSTGLRWISVVRLRVKSILPRYWSLLLDLNTHAPPAMSQMKCPAVDAAASPLTLCSDPTWEGGGCRKRVCPPEINKGKGDCFRQLTPCRCSPEGEGGWSRFAKHQGGWGGDIHYLPFSSFVNTKIKAH